MSPLLFVALLAAGAFLIAAVVTLMSTRGDSAQATGIFASARSTRNTETTAPHPRVDAASPTVSRSRGLDAPVVSDQLHDGVARREFLNRSMLSLFALGLGAFGSASLAFLWRESSGGFGAKINVGNLTDIKAAIALGAGFHYVPAGKMWITEYPPSALQEAKASYKAYPQVEEGLEAGVTALYQKCTHLGCRVPACTSSQWFECPCHGSKFNRVGEMKVGPAPRGLDRFPMTFNSSGELIVDTGTIILGPAIGTNTTGQESEGPSCVTSTSSHG